MNADAFENVSTDTLSNVSRMLKISGLSKRSVLKSAHDAGFRHLLNVSGADAYALYPAAALRGFQLHQTRFRDIFSDYRAAGAIPATYVACSDSLERYAFLDAVYYLCSRLHAGYPVYVFCRGGIGRAPLVSMTALHLHLRLPAATAGELVHYLRPQAQLTALSYAAAQWTCLLPFPSPLKTYPILKNARSLIQTFSERLDHAAAVPA